MSKEFQPYLDQVTRHVERDPGLVFEIQSELRSHLECAASEFEAQGYSRQDAVEESLKAFGDAAQLAQEFKSTYGGRPTIGAWTRRIALWLAFPLAFLAVQLAWTGIRETWWHETSGWHGGKAAVDAIKQAPQPDSSYLPNQPEEIRKFAWSFSQYGIFNKGGPDTIPTPDPRVSGFAYALYGAAISNMSLTPSSTRPMTQPPAFDPWSMDNHLDATSWSNYHRSTGDIKSFLRGALKDTRPDEFLARALAQPTWGDDSGAFWQTRLDRGAPGSFSGLINRYGVRFSAQGLAATVLCADKYVLRADAKANVGDFVGAQKTLDDVESLIDREMAHVPQTKALLPLAIYKLIYLPDCREGILGKQSAGPGVSASALAALSQELRPFQSTAYLPGIKPRSTPVPPGAWVQIAGWVSLINNLLVISLAVLTLFLAGVWVAWVAPALLSSREIAPHQAPGLLPTPVSRVALPIALVAWGLLALFYAGLFANPVLRFGVSFWVWYPFMVAGSVVIYLVACISLNRHHLIRHGLIPRQTFKEYQAGRMFVLCQVLFAGCMLILPLQSGDMLGDPVKLAVSVIMVGVFGVLLLSSFFKLRYEQKVSLLIQVRSLKLTLGLAVVVLALACLALYASERVCVWAAWQSDVLNQPLSDEFKREVLHQKPS